MTKVYDALRQAETERQQSVTTRSTGVGTTALFAAMQSESGQPGEPGNDLQRLREILLGGMVEQFANAVERLEQRMDLEKASLRAELEKFEQRFEDRLVEVDSRGSQARAELREQLALQSRELQDLIKCRSAEAVRTVNEGLAELRSSKLDGSHFSSFVKGLAAHIADADADAGEAEADAA